MKKHLLTVAFLLICGKSFSQVGINTATPTKTLDVNGEMRIRVLPNATTGNYNLILTDNNGNISSADLAISPNTVGDIKKGFQTSDHAGWYLLDGRLLSVLPANVQTAAGSIGLLGNLPNARGKFLKAKTGAEVLGSSAGSNVRVLSQANLPNYNFTGTSSVDGAHNHTWTDLFDGGQAHALVRSNNVNQQWALNYEVGFSTSTNGAHTHSVNVSSEGGSQSFSIIPQNITVNTFIFLGN